MRKPETIIGPHLIERDRVDGEPERRSLIGFLRLAFTVGRTKDMHIQRVTIGDLKCKSTARLHARRSHAQFFLHFADGTLPWRFAVIKTTARPVDLACAETALLADQQEPIGAPHKQERRAFLGRLVCPVNVFKTKGHDHLESSVIWFYAATISM